MSGRSNHHRAYVVDPRMLRSAHPYVYRPRSARALGRVRRFLVPLTADQRGREVRGGRLRLRSGISEPAGYPRAARVDGEAKRAAQPASLFGGD